MALDCDLGIEMQHYNRRAVMSKQNTEGQFAIEVNGAVINFQDPVPTASQILSVAGCSPN